MTRKDRPRPILAKGSRQLQTARSSRAATGGEAASNSDNGDGAASETRTASETPGSAIVTDVSCLAQLRGWLRGTSPAGTWTSCTAPRGIKLELKDRNEGLAGWHHPLWGPGFGGGRDLGVYSDMMKMYSCLGCTLLAHCFIAAQEGSRLYDQGG